MRDGTALGVGWGATLSATTRALAPLPLQGASVVSLLGGMTHSRSVNPSAVARRLADAFGADCYQLTAPLVVADASVRDALWSQPALRELRERARRADLALVSVGEVSGRATLFRERLLPATLLEPLRAAGAVADLLGRFLDRAGRPVAHAVNERIVGVDAGDLARVPRFVVASGGRGKVEALRAVLRGLRVHVLITDEPAARGLLES
jgi:DNA-binding transcriptional regulator LsrR (DeoR family)